MIKQEEKEKYTPIIQRILYRWQEASHHQHSSWLSFLSDIKVCFVYFLYVFKLLILSAP